MWEAIFNYLRYLYHSYDVIPMLAELLLIGFVVYTVIRFLGGTGGEKLFQGILFVVLGFWAIRLLANQLHLDLERIDWLFKYFLLIVLLVAMIAFQPEIRRGLMQLGQTRFSRNAMPELENVIEQVVDAAARLGQTKTGALIAFEREVGLSDLIATGTGLNAKVSAELLHTIFWPGSPLHDMGMIIRRGKIAAAGVQFPLAEHGEYDRLLGSRHRAAIGLSKETDAAIVVISEETGQIGLAIEGKLARFLTLEQLRQQLLELLMPAQTPKKADDLKPEATK
jgi:diadenylate cyclase